jgi:hypothetical protein
MEMEVVQDWTFRDAKVAPQTLEATPSFLPSHSCSASATVSQSLSRETRARSATPTEERLGVGGIISFHLERE